MVGGTVIEVCSHPTDPERLYVNVGQVPYGKLETCAIWVERTETSEQIQLGDSLWWQGGFAYWTPQANCVPEQIPAAQDLQGGIDYDIKIKRIGYSGVVYPRLRIYRPPSMTAAGDGWCRRLLRLFAFWKRDRRKSDG